MGYNLLILIIFTSIISAAVSFPNQLKEHSENSHLINCLKVACNRYCSKERNFIISINDIDFFPSQQLLKQLSMELNQPLIVTNFDQEKSSVSLQRDLPEKTQCFVFLVQNIEDTLNFTQQVLTLVDSYLWNHRGQFFIVISNPVMHQKLKETARFFIEELWKWSVLDVVVIVRPEGEDKSIHLYTWYPFSSTGKCGTSLQEITLIDQWMIKNNAGHFLKNVDLFPRKVPDRLPNCPLRVSTFQYQPYIFAPDSSSDGTSKYSYSTGLEAQLFKAIAEPSGYKVQYLDPPPIADKWGGQMGNGTWFGALGYLVTDVADVAFAGFRPGQWETTIVDVTNEHSRDTCHWFVPPARQIPHWKSIFIIFGVKMWVLIIFSITLISIVFLSIDEFRRSLVIYIFDSWSVLIGVGLNTLPKPTRIRLVFALWVYYCLLINSAYQSVLISVLTDPGRERQVTTTEELVESNLNFGSLTFYHKLFEGNEDSTTKRIHERYHICSPKAQCLQKLADEDDFAYFACSIDLGFMLNELFLATEGRREYTPLRDGQMSFEVTMYLKKYSPHTERFNAILTRIKQSGILSKWMSDIKRHKLLAVIAEGGLSATDDAIKLTLTHFEGAFALLVTGICMSSLIYLAEYIYWRKIIKKLDVDKKQLST